MYGGIKQVICYVKKASILAFASLISACGANDPGLAKRLELQKISVLLLKQEFVHMMAMTVFFRLW